MKIGVIAMKLDKYKKLVRVVFADPAGYNVTFDRKCEPITCCVIGRLIKETKNCIRSALMVHEIDGVTFRNSNTMRFNDC